MNIFAVDTSGSQLNISLLRGESFFELSLDYGLHHTEYIAIESEQLLDKAGVSSKELDLIACSSGPGSFTGLRIGMSFAKGYALGSSSPLVSVPSLDIYAYGKDLFGGPVFPVIDARKNRIYTSRYEDGERVGEILDITPETFAKGLASDRKALITGPYAVELCSMLASLAPNLSLQYLLDPLALHPRGRALVEIAQQHYIKNGGDLPTAGPLYVRPSEAELSASKGAYQKEHRENSDER